MSNLRPLARQAIEHWREHRPQMYERLKKAGTLESEALKAAEQTLEEQATLIEQGIPPDAAWEMVRERYVFLPEEEGASEEAPPTEGYLMARDLNRMMRNLGTEDEDYEE